MKERVGTMKAKTYLLQLQKLDISINQKLMELHQLQSKLKIGLKTISYDMEKIQTSSSTEASFAQLVEKKIDLENEINAEIDSFIDKKHEIINQIQSLDNPLFIMVLYKRYAEYKSHRQITREMYYSIQHVQRLHQQALREFEQKYLQQNEIK